MSAGSWMLQCWRRQYTVRGNATYLFSYHVSEFLSLIKTIFIIFKECGNCTMHAFFTSKVVLIFATRLLVSLENINTTVLFFILYFGYCI